MCFVFTMCVAVNRVVAVVRGGVMVSCDSLIAPGRGLHE